LKPEIQYFEEPAKPISHYKSFLKVRLCVMQAAAVRQLGRPPVQCLRPLGLLHQVNGPLPGLNLIKLVFSSSLTVCQNKLARPWHWV
jgi:hypothetical protein